MCVQFSKFLKTGYAFFCLKYFGKPGGQLKTIILWRTFEKTQPTKPQNMLNQRTAAINIQLITMATPELVKSEGHNAEEQPHLPRSGTQRTRNSGCWSLQEQQKYIIFLEVFRKMLQNKQKRKEYRIFKIMADQIGSRDGIQCRSHHMKQLRTYRQIRTIISGFKKNHRISEGGQEFQTNLRSKLQLIEKSVGLIKVEYNELGNQSPQNHPEQPIGLSRPENQEHASQEENFSSLMLFPPQMVYFVQPPVFYAFCPNLEGINGQNGQKPVSDQ